MFIYELQIVLQRKNFDSFHHRYIIEQSKNVAGIADCRYWQCDEWAAFFLACHSYFSGFSSDLLPSGLFFTVDAIAGIVLQFPISRLVVRIMDTGKTSTYCMGLSLGLYGIAFVLFAAGTLMQSVWFIFAALLVFASAECTYAPLTNVAMVESGENMPLVDILNCRLILTAIGESIGSFCGGFFVPFLTSAFHATWMYWLALSIIAVCGLFVNVSERKCR